MALVAAILVLVFISVIATSMIVNITTDTKIAGRNTEEYKALNVAEAGVAEACERIRKGDIPDNGNPKMVSQIYLLEPGDVPDVGTDSIAIPTWQNSGNWLPYSTDVKGSDVLTVTYKTNTARTKIYRYDAAKNPAIQTTSGDPVFVITSTGHAGDTKRTIITEVIQNEVKTFCKAAVIAKKRVHIQGDSWLCGYDHSADTPDWTDVPNGRDAGSNACNDDPTNQLWELGSNDKVGVWCGGRIDGTYNGKQYGSPSAYLQNQSGFYAGAWELLGMTQNQFFALIGNPIVNPKTLKGDLSGIHYYAAARRHWWWWNWGSVVIQNGRGTGLIYVDGDAYFKGDFVWHGLIYCTGRVQFDGRAWILGCVVSEKDLHLHTWDKRCSVLYSNNAITQAVGLYGAGFVTTSWREKP
jgi:Tfp pilus assembly protein PilX